MADYVRRRIAPLLPGLEPEYLELIVGELEIATETRSGFSAPDDDLEASVVDILQAAGYVTDRAAAKAQCEQILLTLELREGGLRLVEKRDIVTAARGSTLAEAASEVARNNNAAARPASSSSSTGTTCSVFRQASSDQPSFALCNTPSAFAAVAIAVAALTLLGSPKHA